MSSEKNITLRRDITAVQIPSGSAVTLKKGATVSLTQSLGGSFTVHAAEPAGLFRVAGADADALGQSAPAADRQPSHTALEDKVRAVLKTCYDPEIPVNIVDLGLVYSMTVSGGKVGVKMTLTAPGCGMGPAIAADAKNKILAIKGVADAEVEVVWEPQWTPAMISEEGRMRLGIV